MNGSKNLAIGNPESEVERNKKATNEENESRKISKKRDKKFTKIKKPRIIGMKKDIFQRYDRNPKYE